MTSLRLLSILFATLVALTCAQHCRPVRYMAIGDSITEIVCWRAYLWELLQNKGYANVNFVGSNRRDAPGGCRVPSYDKDSEGHSGYLAIHIAVLNLLPKWLEKNPTDVVTIHLGSNDISHGYSAGAILDAMSKLVEQLRNANREMKIIVAQVLPIHVGRLETAVLEFNSRIPLWAASLNRTSSPIWVVDQHSSFEREDFRDGIHPNEIGDRKMAAKWYPAMVQAVHAIQAAERPNAAEALAKFDL